MPDMEYEAAEFRRRADECLELAKQVSLPAHRDRLREMAEEWLALARESERKADR